MVKGERFNDLGQDEEYLDLVDEDDNIIGRVSRQEAHKLALANVRVVNVFIRNSRGQLWIPQRTAGKHIFPLALDVSCGGYVKSGQTYEQTLQAELREELDIDVDTTSCQELGKLTPKNHGVSSFMRVYEIVSDVDPTYNPDDFLGAVWLYPGEIRERIEGGEAAKSDLLILVNHFYLQQ